MANVIFSVDYGVLQLIGFMTHQLIAGQMQLLFLLDGEEQTTQQLGMKAKFTLQEETGANIFTIAGNQQKVSSISLGRISVAFPK